MSDIALLTASHRFKRFRTVSATDNGYPSKIPTSTAPVLSLGTNAAQATSAAVIGYGATGGIETLQGVGGGPYSQNGLLIVPYGGDADDNTFSMRLIAWTPAVTGENDVKTLWVPVPLFEVQATLGSQTGVAGALIDNTQLFADTITLTGTTAIANVNITINSPANNTIAYILVDGLGAWLLEAIFTTGGVAARANGLYRAI